MFFSGSLREKLQTNMFLDISSPPKNHALLFHAGHMPIDIGGASMVVLPQGDGKLQISHERSEKTT